MKIVICDDNVEDLSCIEQLLLEYKKLHTETDFAVKCYLDASTLYHAVAHGALADIYILDMIMSEKTGIDIGSRIRQSGAESVIVYITLSDDYALEAYGVHAARYLLKPVSQEHFFEALDYALSCTKEKKDITYQIKTKDGLVAVPYSKIEYIENYSRMLNVCLRSGESIKSIFIRKSFDEEIREITADKRFLQVHKSFVVNLDYVKKLSQGSILLESGKCIPVSKTRLAGVKKEYLLFVSERYR